MAEIQQQNPDGSWSNAQPLDWQPGLDWEIIRSERGTLRACLYDRNALCAVVESRSRLVLAARMRLAARRWRRG